MQFQYQGKEGNTDVIFSVTTHYTKLKSIRVELISDYESNFPSEAFLERDQEASTWRLCGYYEREIQGEKIQLREWLNGIDAQEIAKRIITILDSKI